MDFCVKLIVKQQGKNLDTDYKEHPFPTVINHVFLCLSLEVAICWFEEITTRVCESVVLPSMTNLTWVGMI